MHWTENRYQLNGDRVTELHESAASTTAERIAPASTAAEGIFTTASTATEGIFTTASTAAEGVFATASANITKYIFKAVNANFLQRTPRRLSKEAIHISAIAHPSAVTTAITTITSITARV
ncbi:hypothetical protein B7486_34040 [cyanobacterium TDX16]|nr:hypothetical protein B7486_34040 [cyanobacterium TDX16]